MTKPSTWSQRLYLFFIFGLLYTPILYLFFYSFNEGRTMNTFQGWTWDHYRTLLADTRLLIIVGQTLILALTSALTATVIGSLGAVSLYYTRASWRQPLLNLNNILLVMPDVMIGASFLILFTRLLPVPMGAWTVFLAHVAFNIPIVVLMVLPRLYEMPDSLVRAGMDLGASWPQILWRIILPNIQPGILSGFFMALTYSLDDFAVTFFVTGEGFTTLSVEIYSRARQGVSLEINALSAVIFVLVLVLVLGNYYWELSHLGRSGSKGGDPS